MPRINTAFLTEPLDKDILALLAAASPNEAYTAREVRMALQEQYSQTLITTRLMALTGRDEITRHQLPNDLVLYSIGVPFRAVHFTPLFFGSPEWRVEHRNGEQLALCKSEFHAKLIASALNGDR